MSGVVATSGAAAGLLSGAAFRSREQPEPRVTAIASSDAIRAFRMGTVFLTSGGARCRDARSVVHGPGAEVGLTRRVAGRDDVTVGDDDLSERVDARTGAGAAVEDHRAGFAVEAVELRAIHHPDDGVRA